MGYDPNELIKLFFNKNFYIATGSVFSSLVCGKMIQIFKFTGHEITSFLISSLFWFCLIFFIVGMIYEIYKKTKEVSGLKFELENSNSYVKVGLARMFYSQGHSYESTMEESLWMFDAEQRKLITITKKEFIFGNNKVEKCFSHFNPKVLKILQDHNFDELYFKDYQHIRLDREQLDKNIKNSAEITFKAYKQAINDKNNQNP